MPRRIGLIVPSSNTTMETELPALFRRRSEVTGEEFTWHSARARMSQVNPEELDRMVRASDAAAQSLADAPVEAIAYACLVAVMVRGAGAHREVESQLGAALIDSPRQPPVVSSAGALVQGLNTLGARRISIITPYMKPLTTLVADYIRAEGIEVADAVALEVSDNVEVGQLDPRALVQIARGLDVSGVEALVVSACVQMPSLPVIQQVEDMLGVPVMSAATATARTLLVALGLDPVIPGAGRLLAAEPATVVRG